MEEMVGSHHRLNGHELEQASGVGDGQGSLECCSPWCPKVSSAQFSRSVMSDSLLSQGLSKEVRRVGKGVVRELGVDMYTLLYLKWIINKDLPHSTGNSAQLCNHLIGIKIKKRIDTCMCITESLCSTPETSINCSPI